MRRNARDHLGVAILAVAWTCLSARAVSAQPEPTAPSPQPSATTGAPGQVRGTVAAESSGTPLSGVSVTIAGTDQGALTDENGQFVLSGLAPGTYTIEVELIGYLNGTGQITVTAAGPVQVDFQLADDPAFSEVIVMVGSRSERTVTQTPVPVDIISTEKIEESGRTETNQILATVAPSYNASHQTVADGSDHINPASLRGLGPDQVLVLVNGKRRHSTALMHVNGTFGRGTVGVDLNAIPSLAIKRIEVLRDGAAAQYGSDAIAGVVNIVLKDYAELLEMTAHTGITFFGDGFETKLGANYGIPIGDGGFVNFTGEFLRRNPTDRSGEWTGSFFPDLPNGGDMDSPDYAATTARLNELGLSRDDVSMRIGQSLATVGTAMVNAQIPLSSSTEIYSFGGATYRDGEAAGFYRRPEQLDRVVPELYPNGFLPEIHTDIFDWSLAVGLRNRSDNWQWDASANHGGNLFLFSVENSNNASLGTVSPTVFSDAGGLVFNQTTANVDAVWDTGIQALKKLSLVMGSEYRLENYQITAGELDSYACGELAESDGKACGAQVFPGFQPESKVSAFRHSASAYLGAESELSDRFLLDAGGRFEYYSDFGPTAIGKLAGRVNVLPNVALRAGVSTGFRAPSLHQVWFSTVSTQFVENPASGQLEPRQVLTARNQSDVADAFGIPDLQQETSLNLSAGFTTSPIDGLTVTADFYRITIDDRIVLSSQFNAVDPASDGCMADPNQLDCQVGVLLQPFPQVSRAQFFLNAVDTETLGADVVIDYSLGLDALGLSRSTLSITGSANFTQTEVQQINTPPEIAAKFTDVDLMAVENVILNREEQNRLEDALPRQKGALSLRFARGPLTALTRANYYGPVGYLSLQTDEDGIAYDESFGSKVTFDLDVGYQLPGNLKLSVGGTNIFNTFPDEQVHEANRFENQFIYSRRVSQFGINGAFYYLRLQYLL